MKLIKLSLACCLMSSVTFLNAVITKNEAYEVLKKFEKDFWKNHIVLHYERELEWYDTLADLVSMKYFLAESVSEYLDPIRKDGIAELLNPDYVNTREYLRNANRELDFSNASMLSVVSIFYQILQCKVDFRDHVLNLPCRSCHRKCKIYKNKQKCHRLKNFKLQEASTSDIEDLYLTDYIGNLSEIKTQQQEQKIDPYFTKIKIGKNLYHFCLDYNGAEVADQPGNSVIREPLFKDDKELDSPAPQWTEHEALNNNYYILQNLLLCLEVSRRHVIDPSRTYVFETPNGDELKIPGFKDIYCDLPILGAIVMGLELMNDQIISPDEFFSSKSEYCCFSGNNRENHIKALVETFCRYKNFQKKKQFLEEIKRLYDQFIHLNVTDRAISLDEEHKAVIQNCIPTKGIGAVNRTLSYCEYHIVDINSEDNSLWFAILQNMNPNKYYEGNSCRILSDKDFQLDAETQVKILNFLEENFQQTFVILDATVTDGNCTKWLSEGTVFSSYYLNCSPLRKKPIVLLYRGNTHWQAVLPDKLFDNGE